MSSDVNVHSIAALEELRSALMRFKDDAQIALTTTAIVIERTRSWLQESLQRWQGELRRRQRALEETQADLKACLVMAAASSKGSGRYAAFDCSPLEVKVSQAKRRVEEAEQEIRAIQYFIKATEEAVASYQTQANRLNNSLGNELLKGAALLSRSVNILTSYTLEDIANSSFPLAGDDTSSGPKGGPSSGITGPAGEPDRSGGENEPSEGSAGERNERYEGPSHGGGLETG